MDETMLKACIMSRKGGVPLNELNRDYKDLVGKDIEFSKTKFKSLEFFLTSFPGVSVKGNMVFCKCEETAHIQDMISKQKCNTVKKGHAKYKKTNNQKTNKRKSIEEHDKEHGAKRPNTLQKKSVSLQSLFPGWSLTKNRSPSLVENHLQNLSYYDYNCVYNERNQLYNLLYSLCMLLSATDMSLSSIGQNINGNSHWVKALKKQILQSGTTSELHAAKIPNFILYGHQVVGDDCMMMLGMKHCANPHTFLGTCKVGLDLLDAQYHLVQHPCSSQVLIACGMLDVHKGKPVEEIMKNMQELILCVLLMGGCPVVCNLPPSPFRWLNHCVVVFNCWLATLTHIQVVDLYSQFFRRDQLNMNLFQRYPISPGGYQFYTWSSAGQGVVMNTISKAIHQRPV